MDVTKESELDPTIDAYRSLLESGVSTKIFYAKMIEFTYKSPYFFSPHLEILNYLESIGLEDEKISLLQNISDRLVAPLSNQNLFKHISATWTKREAEAFVEILKRVTRESPYWRTTYLKIIGKALVERLPNLEPIHFQNLVLMKKGIDIQPLKEELTANEVCWTYNTARQDSILVHKETNAIILRSLVSQDGIPVQQKDLHESIKTSLADLFPQTLACVEEFAKERDASLGRVVLVRLKPHSKVYRHYDNESWLQGRNRYHLVVESKGGSFMTSGVENKLFVEGDIFFFDNKKMHTAENNSSNWRVHVIFDMLDKHPIEEV